MLPPDDCPLLRCQRLRHHKAQVRVQPQPVSNRSFVGADPLLCLRSLQNLGRLCCPRVRSCPPPASYCTAESEMSRRLLRIASFLSRSHCVASGVSAICSISRAISFFVVTCTPPSAFHIFALSLSPSAAAPPNACGLPAPRRPSPLFLSAPHIAAPGCKSPPSPLSLSA